MKKEEKQVRDVHFGGNINFGNQGAGNVQGTNNQQCPPPQYPYSGGAGGGYPPYHHPRVPQISYGQKEDVVEPVKKTKNTAKKKAYEEEEEEEKQKPPPKTEAEPNIVWLTVPAAETAIQQQHSYRYHPQHGGGYPVQVQGYPAHPPGHGHGGDYGRITAGTAAVCVAGVDAVHNVHDAYHNYRHRHGRLTAGIGALSAAGTSVAHNTHVAYRRHRPR